MPRRRLAAAAPADARRRLVDAALQLAAKQGWRRLTMAEIADEAGVSLADAYRAVRSKYGILAALRRDIDAAMLEAGVVAGETPRERLFDALMRRYEALKPHRAGLRTILRDSLGDPVLIGFAPGLLRSMSWTLAIAGIPASGCRGHLARRLAAAIYLSVFPTFLRDESRDLGTTMAALDRRLRQLETVLGRVGPTLRPRRSPR